MIETEMSQFCCSFDTKDLLRSGYLPDLSPERAGFGMGQEQQRRSASPAMPRTL
jgi:hypothetical protein